MSRPIDEDSVINEISRFVGYLDDDMILRLQIAIKRLPTIDAAPVVHGHWYVYETVYEGTEAKCSICGFETLVNEPGNGLHMVGDLKYCPHCGALMDEVTE